MSVTKLSKNPCSKHRYCTCDVYMGQQKRTDCGNQRFSGYSYSCTSNKSDCVGYKKCNDCESYCNYSLTTHNVAYRCAGYRWYDPLTRYNIFYIDKKSSGTQINHYQINAILHALKAEVDARREHLYYKEMPEYTTKDFTEKDVIYADSFNEIVDKIKEIYDNYVILEDTASYWQQYSSKIVDKTEIIVPNPFIPVQDDLDSAYQDCICYSDCLAYGLWRHRTCTCNTVCGCNYWG